MDIAAAIITAAIIALFAIGAIGMNLARPRRCPECGGRDTSFDEVAHFWTGRGWWCGDCEAYFDEGDL